MFCSTACPQLAPQNACSGLCPEGELSCGRYAVTLKNVLALRSNKWGSCLRTGDLLRVSV
jgi:hypothetical protein